MSDVLVPTLPPEIARVPGWREDDAWRDDWRAWREALVRYRWDLFRGCERDPVLQQQELALCAADPARWLALWGWIEEPRPRPGEDTVKPFAPFAFQVELLQWFVARVEDPAPFDGFASKARGLGATWVFSAAALWGWLFRAWRGKLVSRKEDLVDKPKDVDSMFGKIDFMLDHLPPWMLPAGFKRDEHRFKLLLKHPASTAQVTGESTSSKTARGARATYVLYDEAAFIPDFVDVFGTGAGTTDHRFAVSSESFEEGSGWWDAWHAAKGRDADAVRELNWFENPYFDPAWFDAERARWSHDPEGFAREYLRDPYAGFGAWVYPTVRQAEVVEKGYDPAEVLLVGIDPGRADDTAIVFAQVEHDGGGRRVRWVDSYERNLMPAEFYAHVLTGVEPAPGDPCWGLPLDERDRALMAFAASLPTGDRVRFYMDPAGAQKDMSGLSFHDRLVKESKRLRLRRNEERLAAGESADDLPTVRPIVPVYKELFARNRHDTRRLAMRELLARSVFSSTPGALRFKDALENYRFSRPGEKSTGEPAPVHDQWSHLVSAAEYVAVYVSLGLGSGAAPRRMAERLRIGRRAA